MNRCVGEWKDTDPVMMDNDLVFWLIGACDTDNILEQYTNGT